MPNSQNSIINDPKYLLFQTNVWMSLQNFLRMDYFPLCFSFLYILILQKCICETDGVFLLQNRQECEAKNILMIGVFCCGGEQEVWKKDI